MRTVVAAGLAMLMTACTSAGPPRYKDATRPIGERVSDLLARMTIEEKVAQLTAAWSHKADFQDAGQRFNPAAAEGRLGHGLGEVSRPSETGVKTGPTLRGAREHAEYVNAVQRWVMEHARLPIPVMFHEEALHGFVAPGGTMFPVPVALASTWDPALVERVMQVAAKEARARGVHHVLSPVVDLGRDPRWGRFEETYGEDPFLVARFGVAAVRGYQGTTLPLGPENVIATLKHFAGHGSHEGGINTAPSFTPERLLRSEFLVPFEAGVKEAGALAVMPGYHEIDGAPLHAHKWLLDSVLRREWGFRGFVVSDYFGIAQLVSRHHVAVDKADAARQALDAGVDMEVPDADAYAELVAMVKDGRVAEAAIDRAVERVLTAKFLAGLFEQPYTDVDRAETSTNTPAHRALALEAARKGIVLLENREHTLPLDRARLRTLAVIGPNAKGVRLGGYSARLGAGVGVDILDGITARAGAGIRVVHAEGVRITEHEPDWDKDTVELGDPAKNRRRIQDAVAIARAADAIVLVIGTNESTSREAYADNHLGDVADLALSSQQDELADALFATGKPVVVVLVNGRPLTMPRVAERAKAVLEAWYAGQEGGTAIGEALFGDINPGGKLPVSIPRSVGQLPVYYNRRPTSFRPYLDLTREPQWPFGHGLSYTTFTLSAPTIAPATISIAGRATVAVDVTNTGTRAGDEVVQLFIRDVVSSVTRPMKELRGFERVTLAPGATKRVTFLLGPGELSLIDRQMRRVVEPGLFEVMTGASSTQLKSVNLTVTAR